MPIKVGRIDTSSMQRFMSVRRSVNALPTSNLAWRTCRYTSSSRYRQSSEKTREPRKDRRETPEDDLEKRWETLRQNSVAREPRRVSKKQMKETENRRRMQRLGLLPLDDAAPTKEAKEEAPSKNRVPQRVPVAATQKHFVNMKSASDHARNRDMLIPDEPPNPKGLDVAVLGRPNAGKSSLMNSLLDVNISAVSTKYNTTREQVLGIFTQDDTQICFYDTPGLIKPKESHTYVRSLVTTANETVSDGMDLSLLVIDAVKRLENDALDAIEKVLTSSAQSAIPTLLVFNKWDLVVSRKELMNASIKMRQVSDLVKRVYDKNDYEKESSALGMDVEELIGEENVMRISAKKGTGIDVLKKRLGSMALSKPWNYHSSMRSNQSDVELVSEIIRGNLFRRFNQEIPYAIQQENIGWTKFKDNSLRIDQDLFVPSSRMRRMVIGHNGDSVRAVGVAARKEIEQLLKRPIHLYLNVRVRV